MAASDSRLHAHTHQHTCDHVTACHTVATMLAYVQAAVLAKGTIRLKESHYWGHY
jgi:hypothetical protein